MGQISFHDFLDVDMRVGKVTRVDDFKRARKAAYKLWIDFGPLGVKQSSAQITKLYGKEELLDRLVIAVVNFPSKQIADFSSEVLVLGVVCDRDQVVLIGPDREVTPGLRVF